jgi:hypothetical protein
MPVIPNIPNIGILDTVVKATTNAVTTAAQGDHHINTGVNFGFRHYTFVLRDVLDGADAPPTKVILNINPEDLSFDTPYRVTATNTMSGAFVDVWGQGIRRVVMRGHTGWRRQKTVSQNQDGFDNLFELHEKIINQYFKRRDEASKSKPQSDIQEKLTITIIDRLHERAIRVVPETFRLLRNRARPLLHMYEVAFFVVENDDEAAKEAKQKLLTGSDKTKELWAGFDRTEASFGSLGDRVKGLGGPFKDALADLTKTGGGISGMFKNILAAKKDVAIGVAGVRNVALDTTRTIKNTMGTIQSYVDMSGIAADVQLVFAEVKSTYGSLLCLLDEIKSGGLSTFRNINGASTCATFHSAPLSPLQATSNSFEAIRTTNSDTIVTTATNSIGIKEQNLVNKIKSLDTPIDLLGGR